MKKTSLVNLKNVSFSFNGKVLFEKVNLDISRGEIFTLTGESGSGLTTFLRMLSGLIKPLEGTVKIFDVDIHNASQQELIKLRRRLGFVFQHGALLNNMTLIENVALPLRYHTNLEEDEIYQIASDKLRYVGIENCENELPSQLSEECMKRGGFARALALEPSLLFCDELTSGFCGDHSNSIVSIIKKLNEENGVTSVIVSQDKIIGTNKAGVIKNGQIEIL